MASFVNIFFDWAIYIANGSFFIYDVKPLIFGPSKRNSETLLDSAQKKEKTWFDQVAMGVKCVACHVGGWSVQTFLGNLIARTIIELSVVIVCIPLMPLISPFSSEGCAGIV